MIKAIVSQAFIPKKTGFKWPLLAGSSLALAIYQCADQVQQPLVVICEDAHQANSLHEDLNQFAQNGSLEIAHFPGWETLPYERFSPHPEAVSQRLDVLNRIQTWQQGICLVDIATLMQRLTPVSVINQGQFDLKLGHTLELESFRAFLDEKRYLCVSEVHEPGEFAIRGALLDLFPMGSQTPYRIELFDDEIDTIRTFDPETQRSIKKIDAIQLLPAKEFPSDDQSMRQFRHRYRELFDIDIQQCPFYQDLRNNILPAGIEYFLPLFFEETTDFFQYFTQRPLVYSFSGVQPAMQRFWQQTQARYEQYRHDIQHPLLPPEQIFLSPNEIEDMLDQYLNTSLQQSNADIPSPTQAPPLLPIHQKNMAVGEKLKNWLKHYTGQVLIACDSAGRRETLLETLHTISLHPTTVESWKQFQAGNDPFCIGALPLSDGFTSEGQNAFTVLTESQLFSDRVQQKKSSRKRQKDAEALIRDLGDLNIGAPVVHEDHGVGRYLGLQKLDISEDAAEFLTLEYANQDKLYVPVASLHLISRYTGGAPESAPLHRLGGEQWAKVRKKAAEKIRDVAVELLDLYARREAIKGKSIVIDQSAMTDFAATFPFEETDDQLSTIQSVLDDLQAPKSMDRVVCGDVGFGKTEVAMRAAFAVAMAHKQIAVLVPTTLLAQQHFGNFKDRLADWPIRVEVVSRFQSSANVKRILNDTASGKVDILIGTHKLLQNDVRFETLGLVIVDEEQRFGVRQKERLKNLRAEVDMLTLTATPIPRTLNMAMSGLRDLSIIATPPKKRLAVKTLLTEWNSNTIREAFYREMQRGGQVYFLHNEVDSIERMARDLEALIPEARIEIGHGQMPERQLEQVMLDFHRQRFNVLLCTTIVENGIDIPSANTIIINRADRFGLAQLHQLRGRVGRSHHRAYAYLITPDQKSMTSDAKKRLDAISSLEDLGAGFNLATHDLEIRGAGELLGDGQSGQIHEVGFSMYMELLQKAVSALREGKTPDLNAPLHQGCEIDLGVPALIPEDYLPDVHTRLTLYKRIASAEDDSDLKALKIEMIDRFGLLPDPVKNLMVQTRLKQLALPFGVQKISAGVENGRIQFMAQPNIDPSSLIQLIQSNPKQFTFDGQDKIRFTAPMETIDDRVEVISNLLNKLKISQ